MHMLSPSAPKKSKLLDELIVSTDSKKIAKISMKYNVNFKFKDNGIWGASLLALTKLLKKKTFY